MPKIKAIGDRIKTRAEKAEVIRFRLYPEDKDFDDFVKAQPVNFKPTIVVDCYLNGKLIPNLSKHEDFEPGKVSPLSKILEIKKVSRDNIQGNGEKKVFVSLVWVKNLTVGGKDMPAEFQCAPKSTLVDNYYSHSVYMQ
jgi:hypothetical protein